MGVLEAIGSDVPNFVKDVPNPRGGDWLRVMWEVGKKEVDPLTPWEGIRTFTLYP